MPKNLKNIAIVSFSTLLSRVLGLLRDVLMFASFGAGPIMDAFLMAFTVPNLFRRLFGEGALTSAFVPVFASTLEQEGKPKAFYLLNKVVSRLWLVLVALIFAGFGGLMVLWSQPHLETRYTLSAPLGMFM
ncbi:MAG: murein biosynthesis integral membrane protein MurJ, partial [Phototrophicales bacterium]